MSRLAATIAVLAIVAIACAPAGSRTLHEVYLYGVENARLGYAYGSADTLPLPNGDVAMGRTVDAEAADDDPLAVEGARLVDDEPYRRDGLTALGEAPFSVASVPLTTDVRVRTAVGVPQLAYYDGERWFTLGEELPAGRDVDVTPRVRSGRLRGMGALTPREADAVAAALEARGEPLVVGSLAADAYPKRALDGLDEHLQTGLFVQRGVEEDADAYRAPPQERIWEVVARGDGAEAVDEDRYLLVQDRNELIRLWSRLHASALEPPPLPDADLQRETLLAVILSQRPTGGYGIEPVRVSEEGGELFVDVRLTEPAEDALVTQALTHPWLLLRVLRGGIDVAWIRDADDGRMLGVARAGDALP